MSIESVKFRTINENLYHYFFPLTMITAIRTVARRTIPVRSGLLVLRATATTLAVPVEHSFGDKTVENNAKTESNRLSKTMTKFWEKVGVAHNAEKKRYEVQLDGKTLRTPMGHSLSVPENQKQLAHLLAHEWANLPDLKVKTHQLPLTSLAARTVDLKHSESEAANGSEETAAKIGTPDDIRYNLLRYLDTDTCLILATTDEYKGDLRKKQDELYLPLIKEFEDFFTEYAKKHPDELMVPEDGVKLEFLDCETDGLRGNRQTLATQAIVLHWLKSLPLAHLVALERAVLTSKSFLAGAALLRSACCNPELMKELYQLNKNTPDDYFHRSLEEIIEMANLETIFQTEEWGEVEDTHDVDAEDWRRNLAAAALLTK